MGRKLAYLAIVFLAVCLVVFNYYSIPAHDELAYRWLGLSTPHWGDCPQANTLSALIHQQYVGYYHDWSGRIFVHFLVGCFSGFELNTLFDFCNAGMYLLLVWLIMRAAQIPRTAVNYLLSFLLVFLFAWQEVSYVRDAAFCINYLWVGVFTLVLLELWRKGAPWWSLSIFFVYGWGQEAYATPMVAALLFSMVWRSIAERRCMFTVTQAVAWVVMAVGTAFLCCAPAALNRAAGMAGKNTMMSFVLGMAKNWSAFVLGIWPAAMMLLLALILLRKRREFWSFLTVDIEMWAFAGAALGMYTILGSNGFHIATPFLLMGTVLILRYREVYGRCIRKGVRPLCTFALVWFLAGLWMQIRTGVDMKAMLARYQQDSQGITWRKNISPGPFITTCHIWNWDRWARSLFRRAIGHPRDPAIFTEELYNQLYLEPSTWFAHAKEITGTGCWTTPDAHKVLVKRGVDDLSPNAKAAVEAYLKSSAAKDTRFARLPGRLRMQFPEPSWGLLLPVNEFTFTAKDGKQYTIFNRGQE